MSYRILSTVAAAAMLATVGLASTGASARPYGFHHHWHHGPGWGWHRRGPFGWHHRGPFGWHHRHWHRY